MQEVKIIVKQESQGTALKDALRDSEKLKAANAMGGGSAAIPNPNSQMAQILRANEAAAAAKKESADAARAKSDAAAAARETRAQNAADRAVDSAENRRGRRTRLGANLALQAADGGATPGALLSMAGGGGPAAILATTAAVLIGKLINTFVEKMDKEAAGQARAVGLANKSRQSEKLTGAAGQAAAAGNLKSTEAALAEAKAKIGTFADEGIEDQLNLFMRRVSGGRWGGDTSGEKKGIANDEEIARLEQQKRVDERRAHKKFNEGPGAVRLKLADTIAQGDKAGAKHIEEQLAWWAEYDRIHDQGAEDWQAAHGASMKVHNDAQKAGKGRMDFGRLVNSRSGADDIARAASLSIADRETPKLMRTLIGTVTKNHSQAQNQNGRHNFLRP